MNALRKIAAGCMIVCMAVTITGCGTTQGKGAVMGAVLGAAAGAIIGNQSDSGGEGAVIGAVLGAAAGAIIADVHETRSEKKVSAEETVVQYNYKPTQGESLVFENSSLDPSVVRRGSMATAGMQYALLGSGPGKQVTETRTVKRNGEVISKISSQKFTRNDGTWVSTQQFRIPDNWKPGSYTIEQTAETNKSAVSGITNFTVE